MHLYPEPGHSVNEDEIAVVRSMIAALERSVDSQ